MSLSVVHKTTRHVLACSVEIQFDRREPIFFWCTCGVKLETSSGGDYITHSLFKFTHFSRFIQRPQLQLKAHQSRCAGGGLWHIRRTRLLAGEKQVNQIFIEKSHKKLLYFVCTISSRTFVVWPLHTECVSLFSAGERLGVKKVSFELPETKTIFVGLPVSPSTRPCEEARVCCFI